VAGLGLRRESGIPHRVTEFPVPVPKKTRTRGTQVITPSNKSLSDLRLLRAYALDHYPADPVCAFSGGRARSSASIRYLETCTQSRTGRSSAPPSSTPRNRDEPVRMVETPFSYTQSTFSLLSVHVQSTFSPRVIHIQSTWGSTYVVPHARGHRGIYGVQRRMVEAM
jgi:hypothetical protein